MAFAKNTFQFDETVLAEQKKLLARDEDTVLLDASTVVMLSEDINYWALAVNDFSASSSTEKLVGGLKSVAAGERINSTLMGAVQPLMRALSFLELWLLYENIIVDENALNSLKDRAKKYNSGPKVENLEHLVRELLNVVEIPTWVNSKASKHVSLFGEYLRNSDDVVFGKRRDLLIPDSDYALKDGFFTHVGANLGDSDNAPGRALFYFEVSSILDLPLLLHPIKSWYLKEIGQSITTQRSIAYKSLLGNVRDSVSYTEEEIPIPPLADEILHTALAHKISFLEAAQAIRDEKGVKSLRLLIRRLSNSSKSGPHLRSQIKTIAHEIGMDMERRVYSGKMVSSKTLNLSALPGIGPVLEFIGRGKIEVPDLRWFDKPYHAIFNRWANRARTIEGESVGRG